ncbi:MAG: class I SAM-dependent methyltransferase [Candidatus Bipolaricaulia bacterium]
MTRAAVDATRIRKIYDQLAPSYDRREALVEWALIRRQRRRLLSWAGGETLEVGIGTGRSLPHYPADCRITGIDLSEAMLRGAHERSLKLGREVDLWQMDAHETDFADGRFDTVVSNLTVCTFIDPIQALAEMGRVTKPQGRILLLEHGRSRHRGVSWVLDRLEAASVDRHGCHPNRNVIALAQAAGLIVLRADRHLSGLIQIVRARPPEPMHALR